METRDYARIIRELAGAPMAMERTAYEGFRALAMYLLEGNRFSAADVQDRLAAAAAANGPRQGQRATGGVAVIPVYGPISQRLGMMGDISGGTSTQSVAQSLRSALADPQVGAIVLDIDSPGGSVFGVPELADEIFAARGQKPMVAVANSLAASAAYYIAASADEVSVTPSGMVGSIGVYSTHEDWSAFYAAKGIKHTFISAGKHKVEGNPYEPLSEEALAYEQQMVDTIYDAFVDSVARGRGRSSAEVRAEFGEGRVVDAKAAKRLGMVDRIETLDDAVARMMKRRPVAAGNGAQRAEADTDLRRRRARALVA